MLVTLYSLNLLLSVALPLVPYILSRSLLRLPPINPISINIIVSAPATFATNFLGPIVLIDGGLYERGFQFGLAMANLLMLCKLITTILILYGLTAVASRLPIARHKFIFSRSELAAAQVTFLVLALLSFVLLTSGGSGFFNWILNPREGYQLFRIGRGQWYSLYLSTLSVSMICGYFRSPDVKGTLISGLLYLVLFYFSGSKGIVLSSFVATLNALYFSNFKHTGKLIAVCLGPVIGVLIYNLSTVIENLDLQTILSYFDFYKNASDYYNAYLDGSVELMRGKVWLTSFWQYIPRAMWSEKPFVYGSLLINEMFYPGQAELTNTPAFGGAVEQFADFGMIGVAISGLFAPSSIIQPVLMYLAFKRPGIEGQNASLSNLILMTVMFSPAFGRFLPLGMYFAMAVIVVITLVAMKIACKSLPWGNQRHEMIL